MSFATSATDIQTAFRAAWDETTYPVEWPNGPAFTPPATAPGLWLRYAHLEGGFGGFQADMADRPRHRYTGLVVIQGFILQGQGEGALRSMLDAASDFFRNARIGDSLFRTPAADTVGKDAGSYYQINLNCPFQRDTIF